MKYLRLLFKNMWRNPRRTTLTMLSVAVALFVYCGMDTLVTSMKTLFLNESSTKSRMLVREKYGSAGMLQLPESYVEKIRQVPHVIEVEPTNFFAGTIGNDKTNVVQGNGMVPELGFKIFPDQMEDITPEMRKIFMNQRNGFIAGKNLLKRQGWKIGQTVHLRLIWPKPVEISGVIVASAGHPKLSNWMLMNRDYLLDVVDRKGKVDMFWLLVDNPGSFGSVARAVDGMFENSPFETRTETESQFFSNVMGWMGGLFSLVQGISLIVLAAITFVAGNAIAMSVRERTTEIAVMKAIGFQGRVILGLIVCEAVLGALIGGAGGSLAALGLFKVLPMKALGPFGFFSVPWQTVAKGTLLSILIGLLSGLVPAWRAARLHVVTALREVG